MILILEIAAGIVLGFIFLALLPVLLRIGMWLLCIAVVLAIGGAIWLFAAPHKETIGEVLGVLAAVVGGLSVVGGGGWILVAAVRALILGVRRGYKGRDSEDALINPSSDPEVNRRRRMGYEG